MRLTIDHRTVYRFSEPQARLTQLLRLSPEDTYDQSVTGWSLHVDCDARMREGRDGFGNKVTMLYVEGPITGIEIAVSGEVLTNPSHGVVNGAAEPLPPPLFLRATPLTERDDAIAAFANDAVAGENDPVARMHALNGAVRKQFTLDEGRPVSGRTAAEAFGLKTATSRDLAHILATAARSLNVPARYVSGYSTVDADDAPAPHGWVEVHIDGLGWVAFDPWTGICADEAYARIAVALDAAGAAPVAGSRLGEGDEEMDVDVHVEGGEGQ
ncbi:transglutaminase family protein [Sphingomonas immobilis]|uniref:Transglutaminase family protein n=1 Tax=Sphingomonas immobilis TaxID=3063997 RepID=A0ABT9A3P3_9SPHN|nr:transglutaminase family protein [Sphingomonas sp. CA1-15]MDO7844435.1 transglutaminase family protein [Sphingomonas sp. CA1-15]